MLLYCDFVTRSSSAASGVSVVVEQPLDGNYTGDGDFGEEASSSDLEQSSGSILPDDQERVSCIFMIFCGFLSSFWKNYN